MKTKFYTAALVLACLAAGVAAAENDANEKAAAAKDANEKAAAGAVGAEPNVPTTSDGLPLVTELDKYSYARGTQTGQSLRRRGMDLNIEAFMSGLREALAGVKPVLDQGQMRMLMTEFHKRSMEKEMRGREKVEAAKNLAEGRAFLAANKNKEGVKVLPSGLQYKVLKAGTGRRPKLTDRVKTHYRGRFTDGKEFDSSYSKGQPSEFFVGRVIKGWTEALQLMREGARWELYIPPNLAYDARGMPPKIGPNATLIFEVELIEVLGQEPAAVR